MTLSIVQTHSELQRLRTREMFLHALVRAVIADGHDGNHDPCAVCDALVVLMAIRFPVTEVNEAEELLWFQAREGAVRAFVDAVDDVGAPLNGGVCNALYDLLGVDPGLER